MRSLQTSFTQRHKALTILLLALACCGAGMVSLCSGAVGLSAGQVLSVLMGGGGEGARNIVLYARVRRVLGAMLCGGALACGGVVIQGVLGNPLAGPNIIGVNSGAGLGAILCAALLPANQLAVPAAAFLGALGSSMLVYALARRTGASRLTLVLAGVAISSILSAGIDGVAILFPEAALDANTFMVGRLSGLTLDVLKIPAVLSLLAVAGAFALSYELDLLMLGDEVAQSLGLSVRSARNLLLVVAAVLCGSAVSFAGLVGFVGLLVPHMARFLVGTEHKYLLGASLFLGALLVTVCDILSRVLFAPFELPVGILLSLLGGPFFLWLLFRQRGGRRP